MTKTSHLDSEMAYSIISSVTYCLVIGRFQPTSEDINNEIEKCTTSGGRTKESNERYPCILFSSTSVSAMTSRENFPFQGQHLTGQLV